MYTGLNFQENKGFGGNLHVQRQPLAASLV